MFKHKKDSVGQTSPYGPIFLVSLVRKAQIEDRRVAGESNMFITNQLSRSKGSIKDFVTNVVKRHKKST